MTQEEKALAILARMGAQLDGISADAARAREVLSAGGLPSRAATGREMAAVDELLSLSADAKGQVDALRRLVARRGEDGSAG